MEEVVIAGGGDKGGEGREVEKREEMWKGEGNGGKGGKKKGGRVGERGQRGKAYLWWLKFYMPCLASFTGLQPDCIS